jgi:hypothetical protein
MAKPKPKKARPPNISELRAEVLALTARIAGMEIRELNLKGELARFSRDNDSMGELKAICRDLQSTMYVMFESVCNLDDLLRPNAVEALRSKRIQFFPKGGRLS